MRLGAVFDCESLLDLGAKVTALNARTVLLPDVGIVGGKVRIAALDLNAALKQKSQRGNVCAIACGIAAGHQSSLGARAKSEASQSAGPTWSSTILTPLPSVCCITHAVMSDSRLVVVAAAPNPWAIAHFSSLAAVTKPRASGYRHLCGG